MKKISFFALLLVLISCNKNNEKIEAMNISYPDYFPSPVYAVSSNQFTFERFNLGKKLFFEKRFSSDNSISCGSCHSQTHAFADHNIPFSFGVGGAVGTRNSPSIVNLAWSPSFMWDGGVNHLEVFPIAPITNHLEMNESIAGVLEKLNADETYRQLFKKAYGNEQITDQAMLKAMAVYMYSIVSYNSKYDQYRKGETTLTSNETQGMQLFQQKCASCHTEPLFTNYSYQNNGLDSVFSDLGRALITQNASDEGKFKVPTLRNIELTYPYMHDGRFWTLQQVLNHYSSGVKQSSTLAPSLSGGIPLTSEEKALIIDFLETLTDYDLLGNQLYYE